MVAKLLNLLAVSSLAIIVCSFHATPVSALSMSGQHIARHIPAHDAIAKKKRNNKHCGSPHSSSSPNVSSYSGGPSNDDGPNDDPSDGGYDGPSDSSAPSDSGDPSGSNSPSDSYTPSDLRTPSDPNTPNPQANSSNSPPPNNDSGDAPSDSPKPNSSNTPNTSVSPASGSPPSSGGSGHKVGLAWPNGEDDSLKNFKTDRVTMLYTWSPYCPSQSRSLGFNCIPMLWGRDQTGDFQNLVVQGYGDTVLGFNEPNEEGQSNLSPGDAAQLWQQYIDPLKNQGYKLISPATSSSPAGKDWMVNFFGACSGCHFDGVAAHWYDVGSQKFIDYINDFHNTFNMDIWVTEFACQNFNGGAQCSQDEIFSFMSTVTKYMDEAPWVAAYFAFGVMHNMQGVNDLDKLMADNGQPTDLGFAYINSSN